MIFSSSDDRNQEKYIANTYKLHCVFVFLITLDLVRGSSIDNYSSCPYGTFGYGCNLIGEWIPSRSSWNSVYPSSPQTQTVPSGYSPENGGDGVVMPPSTLDIAYYSSLFIDSAAVQCLNVSLNFYFVPNVNILDGNNATMPTGDVTVVVFDGRPCANCQTATGFSQPTCSKTSGAAPKRFLQSALLTLQRSGPLASGYSIQIYEYNGTTGAWRPVTANWTSDASRALALPLHTFATLFVSQIPPPPVSTPPAVTSTVRIAAVCPDGPSTCDCGAPVSAANVRIGLRVARGAGWGYGNQDGGGLGTVVCSNLFESGWYQVQWDWADEETWAALPSQLKGCNVAGQPCSERCACTQGRNYYQGASTDSDGGGSELIVASCDVDLAVWTAFAAIQGVGGAAPMFWDQCLSAVAARAMLTPKPYLVIAASLLKEALLALALARLGLGGGRGTPLGAGASAQPVFDLGAGERAQSRGNAWARAAALGL